MTSTPEENKRIVRRIRDDIEEQGDLDAVDEIFAEDAVVHGLLRDFSGRDEIREMFAMDREAFPDDTETIHDLIAEGDTVAVRMTERGTHDSEFMGIEPTGNEFEIQTMAFLRLEGGKVAEWWVQPDLLGFLRQLGVSPEELSAAVRADD
ncbi:ester cyclase [Salinirubellus salinus]|uniref:Ester cyclase n=1 Tax=Salinirubellus salinus TaxID=1364945 RepID=A0A9E7R0P5_9EURY|nr:ester cyclase [Salinirubellus salinus]UWM53487.1 ester cyclase [Salinirubellus salinus]